MKETYKMLVGLTQNKYKNLSMEQLAIEYQKELNHLSSGIFVRITILFFRWLRIVG